MEMLYSGVALFLLLTLVAGLWRVGLEFVVRPPSEAGRARGSEFAIGNYLGRPAWLWIHH